MAPNPNNTHHSASNQMFPYYLMYSAGLQYPDFSSTTPPQVSNRFPTPELVEGQSQFTYNGAGGTTITPASLAEQAPVPRDIHHTTYTVCQAGLGGAKSPAGLQQTFPMSYDCVGDDCRDFSAGPLEKTQPPRIDLARPSGYGPAELASIVFEDLAGPLDYRPAEPALVVFDNQDYATRLAETQPYHAQDPSSGLSTHDGLHRCPLGRKPSRILRCGDGGCPQVFKCNNSLKRHRKTAHLKTGLLDCPFYGCLRVGDNGFNRSDNLRQHRRSKHGEDIPWEKVRLHGLSIVRTAR